MNLGLMIRVVVAVANAAVLTVSAYKAWWPKKSADPEKGV